MYTKVKKFDYDDQTKGLEGYINGKAFSITWHERDDHGKPGSVSHCGMTTDSFLGQIAYLAEYARLASFSSQLRAMSYLTALGVIIKEA